MSGIEGIVEKLEKFKNIDFSDIKSINENIKDIKDFYYYNNDNMKKVIQNAKFLNIAGEEPIGEFWDILIISTINDILGTSDIGIMTFFSLLKNIEEPNYNTLPKVYGTNTKYTILMDLLFSRQPEPIKVIQLIEYLRQQKIGFDRFINLSLRVKLIDWCRESDPKSFQWFIDFYCYSFDNKKFNINDIINKFKD